MLELRNVNASIGIIPILRDLNFKIEQAQTVALIGRNGAGKTTLLRTIMGFTKTTGEIVFDGKSITAMHPPKRPGLGIGYAPEDRRLFSAFTVEENILLPAQAARLDKAETEKRLDRAYRSARTARIGRSPRRHRGGRAGRDGGLGTCAYAGHQADHAGQAV